MKKSKISQLRLRRRLPLGLATRKHKDLRKESSRIACRKAKSRSSALRGRISG